MKLEAALIDLIAQLEGGGDEGPVDDAGARVTEAIETIAPGSLPADEHQRVKQLYALAMSHLNSRRSEIELEIKRVSEARNLLRSCMRAPQPLGDDCDIAG